MTIANDIIHGRMPAFSAYLQSGESLDDIDEYGFTPLIESVLAQRLDIMKQLVEFGVDVNKPDMAGRTALQWAVDNQLFEMSEFLLEHGANPNAFTRQGFSALVYPILRHDEKFKRLLIQHGASIVFAQDFIAAKLLGHRFSLKGTVDVVTPLGEMMEVFYEGFVLEFTVATLENSLGRFMQHFAARRWKSELPLAKKILEAFQYADQLLTLQRMVQSNRRYHDELAQISEAPLLILPAASSGHAMGFIRYQNWFAKIDRGENSLREGSINIYEIHNTHVINAQFLDDFIFRRQPRNYFHEIINHILGLKKIATLPMSSQITGNCSWANMEACIAVSHWMLSVYPEPNLEQRETGAFYMAWLRWDQDRSIEELIAAYQTADKLRKASMISMLCGVLFQHLESDKIRDVPRAEKILNTILSSEYVYVLQSYLDVYCDVNRQTAHGQNLLQLMDSCGYDPYQLGLSLPPPK